MSRHAVVFEEHASVLPHWVGQGMRGATVVCFDAHLDLQFIGPERISRLRACGGAAELARLEAAHPYSPRRDGCYGIEDFLCAGAQLGVLKRLVWVAPPHVLADSAAGWMALRQMEGVTPEDLASLRRVAGGWIEGRLLGLEIAVLEWEQLGGVRLDAPVLLDIDADYFVQVPQGLPWVHPRVVVDALQEWAGDAQEVTIARSVDSGFLPLRHRWLADHVAAAWEGREKEALFFDRLFAIEAGVTQRPARAALLRQLAADHPWRAAPWYALAQDTTDAGEHDALIARAAALDPHYAGDLLREIAGLRVQGRPPDLAGVMRLQRQLAAWRGPPERVAAAWVALGLLFADFGRLPEAVECDAASRLQGRGHPDLALHIGRLELAAGRLDAALPWLEAAAADEETRVGARLALLAHARQPGSRVRWPA